MSALEDGEDPLAATWILERAKRRVSALQAGTINDFVQQSLAQDPGRGVTSSEQYRSMEAEVGFSRGESPYVGAGLMYAATALYSVLPHTLAALREGKVSEHHARVVADHTNHLKDEHRRAIDEAIAHRLGTASTTELRRLIEGHALRLDRRAADARAADNKARRRVCADPAGDDLTYVTATVTTAQSTAIMQTLEAKARQRLTELQKHQREQPQGAGEALPSLEQLKVDLFVELLTGQTTADGVSAEVLVVMQDSTLLGDDDLPAWIVGHGPISAGAAKDWLSNPEATKLLRRLYTRPEDGQLVSLESRGRYFPEGLSKILRVRDDMCATPWCNSPVTDADHRTPWAQGGPTSWDNGLGLCKRCKQRKEYDGWAYTGTPDELTVTTPSGHQYSVPTRPPLAEIARWNSDPPTCKYAKQRLDTPVTLRLTDAV